MAPQHEMYYSVDSWFEHCYNKAKTYHNKKLVDAYYDTELTIAYLQ